MRQRLLVLSLASALLIGLLFIRLIYLQVILHEDFVEKSQSQLKKVIKIHPHRGTIYDRNGSPLALSIPAYSVYAVPHDIEDKTAFAKAVAPILERPWKRIYSRINTRHPFVWLRRKVLPETVSQIKALKLSGVNYIKEEKRVYPNGTLAADIIGFIGTDGGLGGLEYQFDSFLSGSAGKIIIEGDPRGHQIISGKRDVLGKPKGFRYGVTRIEPGSFDGGHVHTTIDHSIQYLAQKYLAEAVKDQEAKKGSIIVMDPENGEILAMADYPEFNPNTFHLSTNEELKNSNVVDIYEPGSVLKIMTFAAALEEKIVTPNMKMAVPETLQLANRTIKEAHGRKEGETDSVTASEVIQKSLNVGTTLMALDIGELKFYKYLKRFGFGRRTGIQLPGESAGLLRPQSEWSQVDIGMISFGQGIGVTPLQLATAMSAVANDGVLVKPRIIRSLSDHESVSIKASRKKEIHTVVSKKTATEVLETMRLTVEQGTGFRAKKKGFSIGAKTGTAQIAGPGGVGYLKDQYIASFMGTFPTWDPKVVILVSVHSPKKEIWGSSVAGPVFKKLEDAIIDFYNIPPDDFRTEATFAKSSGVFTPKASQSLAVQ